MQFDYSLLDLMNRKYIDDFKSEYCFTNDINLIRIPYWDFNIIEQILINELNLMK